MEASQEELRPSLVLSKKNRDWAVICAGQEETRLRIRAVMSANQEELRATINADQEMKKTIICTIHSAQTKLEETITK